MRTPLFDRTTPPYFDRANPALRPFGMGNGGPESSSEHNGFLPEGIRNGDGVARSSREGVVRSNGGAFMNDCTACPPESAQRNVFYYLWLTTGALRKQESKHAAGL